MALNDIEKQLFLGSGIAAYLPGMRYLMDQMGRLIGALEIELAAQQGHVVETAKKRGRPPKILDVAAVTRVLKTANKSRLVNGWPADPAARSKEMKRRQKVAQAKREAAEALRKTA